jgi:kinesin family protein C1
MRPEKTLLHKRDEVTLAAKLAEAEAVIRALQTRVSSMEATSNAHAASATAQSNSNTAAIAAAASAAAAAAAAAAVAEKTESIEAAEQRVAELQAQLAAEEQRRTALAQENESLVASLTEQKGAVSSIAEGNRKLKEELSLALSAKAELEVIHRETEARVNAMTAEIAQLTEAARAHQATIDQLSTEGSAKDEEIRWLQSEVEAGLAKIEALEDKVRAGEQLRRKLHNTVLELKGNIRVFARVRPAFERDTGKTTAEGEGTTQIVYPGDNKLELTALNTAPAPGRAKVEKASWGFSFDRVFGPETTQEAVFEDLAQLVQSVLDGYRVCVFAYGQTGSGKTHTMEGGDGEARGVIPRAVEQIFATTSAMSQTGWTFDLSASYLEIYNESIYDLVAEGPGAGQNALDIRVDKAGEVSVPNLTLIPVTTQQQVHQILSRARRNRSTARTNCNEHSSRSHSVFQVRVKGVSSHGQPSIDGLLSLIDLAGSERLKESQAEGARLKETQAINKSLSALGDVISSLANKDGHVPYRYRNRGMIHLFFSFFFFTFLVETGTRS